jgi:hypothetical protein
MSFQAYRRRRPNGLPGAFEAPGLRPAVFVVWLNSTIFRPLLFVASNGPKPLVA